MIEKIKSLDIKQVIEDVSGLQWRKNILEKCPFCGSGTGKNKSSALSVKKNTFKCFGCDAGGSAIDFVMKHHNVKEHEAINFLAKKYNIAEGDKSYGFTAKFEKLNDKFTDYVFGTKPEFTDFELKTLGRKVTKEVCAQFNCESLEYYITKASEEKPASYKISSTPEYPIYLFSYKKTVQTTTGEKTFEFKRVYQPLSKDHRFFWVGFKPSDYIFADNKTAKLLEKAEEKIDIPKEDRIETLILCTGTSDAMNVYAEGIDEKSEKQKYNVIWLNSETNWHKFSSYHFKLLDKISLNFYVLPDLDKTGREKAYQFCLKYLDTKIIWLPADLSNFRRNGKPCKDVKDFFNIYKSEKYTKIEFYFKELVRVANSLRFWDELTKKKAKKTEFYLSNERIYQFLQANGFYRIPSKNEKKGWVFVHIQNNIVKQVNDESVAEYVNAFVTNFLKNNLDYFDAKLIDKIHKSNEFKIASLSKLQLREDLDFKLSTENYDYFTFKNVAWKITNKGIEEMTLSNIDKFIWDYKIIDFDAKKTDAPFEISLSQEYLEYQKKKDFKEEFSEEKKFDLQINDTDFSYIKYLYNTGRVFWQKEKNGEILTETEKKQQDLFFISKCVGLGYVLYRYKEKSKAWCLYATDTEIGDTGEHKGGTGKSIYMETPSYMGLRKDAYVDGQENDLNNQRFAFGNVSIDTDFVFMEDVDKNVDLHKYMNVIQGKMKIEPKSVQYYVLPFDDSPKIIMNSNHAVRNLDASLRRRMWFAGFCDYYHAANAVYAVQEHTPFMEFGKNLMTDYTPEEKNKLFNFLAQCVVTYLKFREKIESPASFVERRNMQREIGDSFLEWAEDYFMDDKLNSELVRDDVFNNFISTFTEKEQKFIKNDNKFKKKLEVFAVFKGWELNPLEMITNKDDVKRRRIRKNKDGKKIEYIYFRTADFKYLSEIEDLPDGVA